MYRWRRILWRVHADLSTHAFLSEMVFMTPFSGQNARVGLLSTAVGLAIGILGVLTLAVGCGASDDSRAKASGATDTASADADADADTDADTDTDTDADTDTDTDTDTGTYGPVDTRSFAAFDAALSLVVEVDLAAVEPTWVYSSTGASHEVQSLLGSESRVIPPSSGWTAISYTVGAGLGLEAGRNYVLELEYPEDVARSMFIINRGAETMRGFHTGGAIGDALGGYTHPNPESLSLPLSGDYAVWRQFFTLHDRYPDAEWGGRALVPEAGIPVVLISLSETQNPLSAGAAARAIRLYEVTEDVELPVVMPPSNLPQRHVFWREEMADAVIEANADPVTWGFDDRMDWYRNKIRLMRFLGINTLGKDLLEFGTNQGWNSSDWQWYYNNDDPTRWNDLLTLAADSGVSVMPYFEYAGSVGPNGYGSTWPCATLDPDLDTYTHIWWSERYCVDVSDPAALTDVTRLIDETMSLYAGQNEFVGAWFRTRPSHIPMSFADETLRRFEGDLGYTASSVTRETLAASETELSIYKEWWYGQRKAFLLAIRDHLQANVDEDAVVLFTADHSESGRSLPGNNIVTDDTATVAARLSELGIGGWTATDFATIVADDAYRSAQLSELGTWGGWEWQHSIPPPDPASYTLTDDIMMTYSMSKTFTVSSTDAFEDFRTRTGLAAIRHYELNEAAVDGPLGYFVSDVEPAGHYSMRVEALAVANGDPRYLGYLAGHTWNHGFPEHARRFYANFLALPALPSTVVAAADDSDVVVRRIDTDADGTYYAVVHTGREEVTVNLTLDAAGLATHLPTGGIFGPAASGIEVTLHPFELLAIHVQ